MLRVPLDHYRLLWQQDSRQQSRCTTARVELSESSFQNLVCNLFLSLIGKVRMILMMQNYRLYQEKLERIPCMGEGVKTINNLVDVI